SYSRYKNYVFVLYLKERYSLTLDLTTGDGSAGNERDIGHRNGERGRAGRDPVRRPGGGSAVAAWIAGRGDLERPDPGDPARDRRSEHGGRARGVPARHRRVFAARAAAGDRAAGASAQS